MDAVELDQIRRADVRLRPPADDRFQALHHVEAAAISFVSSAATTSVRRGRNSTSPSDESTLALRAWPCGGAEHGPRALGQLPSSMLTASS
jgi:hypothetical protein